MKRNLVKDKDFTVLDKVEMNDRGEKLCAPFVSGTLCTAINNKKATNKVIPDECELKRMYFEFVISLYAFMEDFDSKHKVRGN